MPIYDTPRGWKIKGVKGYHRSKAAAERQLKAVKASQSKSEDKPKKSKSKTKRPGLWENIRKKRARGEKPARKGSKAYKSAVKAAKAITKAEKKKKGKK